MPTKKQIKLGRRQGGLQRESDDGTGEGQGPIGEGILKVECGGVGYCRQGT